VTDNDSFSPAIHQLCGHNLNLHFSANIQYPRRPVTKVDQEAQRKKNKEKRNAKTQAAGTALSKLRNEEEQKICDRVHAAALNSKPASQQGFTSNISATIPQQSLISKKPKNRGPKRLARGAAKTAVTKFRRKQGFEDRQIRRAQHPSDIDNTHKDLAAHEDGVVNKDESLVEMNLQTKMKTLMAMQRLILLEMLTTTHPHHSTAITAKNQRLHSNLRNQLRQFSTTTTHRQSSPLLKRQNRLNNLSKC
jgi:hypothetical protein